MFDEEDFEKIKKLTLEGRDAADIADKMGCETEEILKLIGVKGIISEYINLETQAEAFKLYDEGKTSVDLVKEGVTNIDKAGLLYNKYMELSRMVKSTDTEKESIEKLSTQLGLMGSRLARLELKIMNSILLPKTRTCSHCGETGTYGIGVVCSFCGKVDAEVIEKGPQELITSISKFTSEEE